jgi:hypothetical protein
MKKLLWMAMATLLVSGCGELSYKRGASTQDLEAAKAACQSAGSDKAAEQCLEDKGWTVKKLDDMDLFATVGVSPDNRNPSAFTIPAFVPVTPASQAAVAPAAPAAAPSAERSALANKASVASAGAVASSSIAPPPLPTAPSVPPPPPASPLDIYTISSWWKIGADREALAADTNECVTTLGEAHKPNAKTQQVTRGFVVCMHGKGWKALRAVAS